MKDCTRPLRPLAMKKITTLAEKYVSLFETNEICQNAQITNYFAASTGKSKEKT